MLKNKIFFTVCLAIMTFLIIEIRGLQKIYEIPLYAYISFSFIAIPSILFSYKNMLIRSAAYALSLCVIAFFAFLAYIRPYYYGIKSYLEVGDIDAIMQTNTSEATFYVLQNMYTHWGILAFFIVLALMVCNFKKQINHPWLSNKNTCIRLAGSAFFAVSLFVCIVNSPIYNLISKRVHMYLDALVEFKKIQHELKNTKLSVKKRKQAGELYVIIIGESQSRDFMDAFSPYPLMKNTPWLSAQKDNAQWTFFKNSYTFASGTVPSVTASLTDGRALTGMTYPKGENIITFSRRHGITTLWLSNQNKMGHYDSPIAALASIADKSRYTDDTGAFGISYDKELLPLLDQELALIDPHEDTLIILHLNGSHSPYHFGYDTQYTTYNFSDSLLIGDLNAKRYKEKFNHYTTTNLYTDDFLKSVNEKIEKLNMPSVMMYYSDHGEDVPKNLGHHASAFTWRMGRIPFMVWLSEAYEERYPEKMVNLKANQDKIFTNDLIFDAYAGLLHVDDVAYKSAFDISSSEYSITAENAIMSDGKPIKEDVAIKNNFTLLPKNTTLYGSNTPFKTADAYAYGIRAFKITALYGDLGKDGKGLYVGNNAENAAMSFASYLELCDTYLEFLWLHIKNIEDSNAEEIFSAISKLDEKYALKNRVLIETSSYEAVHMFAKAGYAVTYQLPWERLLSLEPNSEEFRTELQELSEKVTSSAINGLSYALEADSLLQKYLRPLLPSDVKYYAWEKSWKYEDADIAEKLQPYTHLERIGIHFDSSFTLSDGARVP